MPIDTNDISGFIQHCHNAAWLRETARQCLARAQEMDARQSCQACGGKGFMTLSSENVACPHCGGHGDLPKPKEKPKC